MPVDAQVRLPDGTWKFCERRYVTGIESTALWARFPLSPFPQSQSPETDGSQEPKPLGLWDVRGTANISFDSSSWGSTLAPERGRS